MAIRLYMDQDSANEAVVQRLRLAGFDVLTSLEAGRERASDSGQLAFATADRRAIYTANRKDFAQLHKEWMEQGRDHAGIITRSRQQMSVGDQVRGLTRICLSDEPKAAINAFQYLEAWIRPGE